MVAKIILLGKRVAIPILLIFLWAITTPKSNSVIPSPSELVASFAVFVKSRELIIGIFASAKRILIAFGIAGMLGILAGIVTGIYRKIGEVFDPLFEMLRPISPLAWVPLAILWFGISDQAMVFILAYATFFPIFVNTVSGIRGGNRIFSEVALTMGATDACIIWEVILPEALPNILTGLRISMGLAFGVIVAAELAGGYSLGAGLGFLMVKYSMITLNMSRVISLVTIIGLCGFLSDNYLRYLQKRLTPWKQGTDIGE